MSDENGQPSGDDSNPQGQGPQQPGQQQPPAGGPPDANQPWTQPEQYGQQPAYDQQNPYAQQGPYGAQPPPYGQPGPYQPYSQPGQHDQYGQPTAYAQQGPYGGQPAYGQPGAYQPYGQPGGQPAYGQPGGPGPYGAPGQPGYGGQYPTAAYGAPGGPGQPGGPGGGPNGKKPWYSRWYVWVSAGAVIVLALAVVGIVQIIGDDDRPTTPTAEPTATQEQTQSPSPSSEPTETTPPSGEPSTGIDPDEEMIGLGEAYALGDEWTVTVEDPNMDDTDAVMDYSPVNDEPDEGMVYATVTTTITNEGDEPINMFWDLYISYVDDSGEGYSATASLIPDDAWELDDIEPGETASGSWGFIVPEDSSGGHWELTSDSSFESVSVTNS